MHAITPAAAGCRRLRWQRAVWGTCAAVLLAGAPARAQTRSASVRVNVTVLDFDASAVIGAHGLAAPAADPRRQTTGVTRDGASWRITTGGNPAVGVRLEAVDVSAADAAPVVSLCEVAVRPAACQRADLPAMRVTSVTSGPEWLLRVGRAAHARRDDGVDQPVRLTIAYIGM